MLISRREAARPRCLIPRLVFFPPECASHSQPHRYTNRLTEDPSAPGTALGPEKGTFPLLQAPTLSPNVTSRDMNSFLGKLAQEPTYPRRGTRHRSRTPPCPLIVHCPPSLASGGLVPLESGAVDRWGLQRQEAWRGAESWPREDTLRTAFTCHLLGPT